MKIVCTVNGRRHELTTPPLRRLLDILREDLELIGTKEGCGEGECGACAVLIDGKLVNACLVPAFQLADRQVTTIEGLGSAAALHPVQAAFFQEGATQCGFCTPGMVMASHALLKERPRPTRAEIRRALAGNICRCTGYERIFRAVAAAAAIKEASSPVQPSVVTDRAAAAVRGEASAPAPPSVVTDRAAAPGSSISPRSSGTPPESIRTWAPTSLTEALRTLAAHGDQVTPVAGATDLLVESKLAAWRPAAVMDLSQLRELRTFTLAAGRLRLGAGITFAALQAHPEVRRRFPALVAMASQIGAMAIQNRATLGGNLVTASPAADAPPILLALGASACLQSAAGERRVPLDAFFTGYRRTARRPDELLVAVEVPLPTAVTRQAFFKVGTRAAQAIAKVSLGICARRDRSGCLRDVRLAAGSVGPTPLPLPTVAAALEGRVLSRDTLPQLAAAALSATAAAVQPIDDVRSTAAYRSETLGRLIGRFLREGCPAGTGDGD